MHVLVDTGRGRLQTHLNCVICVILGSMHLGTLASHHEAAAAAQDVRFPTGAFLSALPAGGRRAALCPRPMTCTAR